MADKVLGHSGFGRFDLELIETDGVRGWKAKAKGFTDEEFESFLKKSRESGKPGRRLIDIPRGFYRLPSVVDGLPVISFAQCFDGLNGYLYQLKPKLRIENIDLLEVDFRNAITCYAMFVPKIFANTKKIKLDCTHMRRLKYSISMFQGCEELESINLTGAKFDSLVDATCMFKKCYKLRTLGDITTVRFSKLALADNMFYDCHRLSMNMDLTKARLSELKSAKYMFYRCRELKGIHMPTIEGYVQLMEFAPLCKSIKDLDLSMLKVLSRDKMEGLCIGCDSLRSLKLPKVETYSTEDPKLEYLCSGCTELETVEFPGNYDSTPAESGFGSGLFRDCPSLREIDLRFLGDIDLGNLNIHSKHAVIVHCTSGVKVPENAVELDRIDDDTQSRLSKMAGISDRPQMIVVRHNDSLYGSIEEAEKSLGELQSIKTNVEYWKDKTTMYVDVAKIKAPVIEGIIQIAGRYEFIRAIEIYDMCLKKDCKNKQTIYLQIVSSDDVDSHSRDEQYNAFVKELESLDTKQRYFFYTQEIFSSGSPRGDFAFIYEKKRPKKKRGTAKE